MNLEIRGIRFAYASEPILKDVTLEVIPGEITAIVGPNGSGKSTLLRCVDGILRPQGGSVLLDGCSLQADNRRSIARKIALVPQEQSRRASATVFDVVLSGRRPHRTLYPRQSDLEIVTEVIRQLDLSEIAMRRLGELSGGQKQKVMVARALAQESRVLLLDEPTSSLDLRHQLEVLGLVKRLTRTRRLTTLVAIHDLNLASRFCDRLVMLRNGRIFAAGDAGILTSKNIEAVYGVKATVMKAQGRIVVVPEAPVA